MNLSFYFAVVCAAVVSIAQWIAHTIVQAVRGLLAVVQRTARAGRSLLRTAWHHPIASITAVVTTVAAWLVFGWVPLLSAFGVVALLGLAVRFGVRLFRWLTTRRAPVPQQTPATPHRNGQRMNRSSGRHSLALRDHPQWKRIAPTIRFPAPTPSIAAPFLSRGSIA